MVLTAPTKVEYIEFEELNPSGLSLAIEYTNGAERVVTTGYTLTGYDASKPGTQTVTVEYNGQTATFEVNVIAKQVMSVQLISGNPETVIIGEAPDFTGIMLNVTYADGTSKEITEGYTVSDFVSTEMGEKEVTVTYREGSVTFTTTVIDYIRGDINGDGIVSIKDVTRLEAYLNDNSIDVIDYALNVNGDEVVSIKDITRLVEYLNDNSVEIH